MNIFYLSPNPVVAAQMACDKHVVKMVVESAQMLSTAHRMLDGEQVIVPSKSGKRMVKQWLLSDARDTLLYKSAHPNHPSTVWTRLSSGNYQWHYEYFVALCDEYTHRYGKVHMTDTKLRNALATHPTNIHQGRQTTMALAMNQNPECQFPNDPIKSYRMFYKTKSFKMVWTNRNVPTWYKKSEKSSEKNLTNHESMLY